MIGNTSVGMPDDHRASSLGGNSVNRHPSTVRPLLLAAAIVSFGASAAFAQQGGTQSESLCEQVKSPAARNFCVQSREQFANGSYRLALVSMRKALEASPKEGILRAGIGRIMMRFDNFAGAERELRQARQDGAPDHVVLPVLFRAMVNRHEELNLLNEFPEPHAGQKGPVVIDTLQGRAMALEALDRIPEAVATIDRSLSMNRNIDALLLRSRLATRQNDEALAKKLIDEAYRLDPKHGPVLASKLEQLERVGDPTATIAFSDQILKLYPRSGEARAAKIRAYLKRNDDARAKQEVDAIFAASPGSPLGRYYSAVLLSRAKDKRGAFDAIMTLPPEFLKTNPAFGVQMAQIASDNGNDDRAAVILGAALGADPALLEVRIKLATLKLRQNSPQAALLVLTPAVDSHDPRVQKLMSQARTRIAKDRSF